MKIATFNINNINKRLPNLLSWLAEAEPDVVCLQEIKTEDRAFPAEALRAAGYSAVWRGQRTWHGVAILARGSAPVPTQLALPGDPGDKEARYIEAAIRGVIIASIYLPNGNPAPGPKFDYKLRWFDRLIRHAETLIEANVPVVLAGDFNVVPSAADIYPTRSYVGNALVLPESRAAFQRLLDQGWTDAIRAARPDEPTYTFWSYMRDRWRRDAGLRLDHLLVSPKLAGSVTRVGVDRAVRGEPGASDHAPAWIDLSHAPKPRRSKRSGPSTPKSAARRPVANATGRRERMLPARACVHGGLGDLGQQGVGLLLLLKRGVEDRHRRIKTELASPGL